MCPRPKVISLSLALLSACAPTFSVPSGARISCEKSADCPGDLICHANWCVPSEDVDSTPPDLAQPPAIVVAPPSAAAGRPLGRQGSTFSIDLEVTEPLAAPPEVTLQLVPAVRLGCSPTGALAYRCTYLATGGENGGRGGVIAFDVHLVDAAQNEVTKPFAGALELDFASPRAVSAGEIGRASCRERVWYYV